LWQDRDWHEQLDQQGSYVRLSDGEGGLFVRSRFNGRLRLRTYLATLIALFVLAALAGALYVQSQSDSDARTTGFRNAAVAAQSAARLIRDGSIILQGAFAGVASGPGGASQLLAHPTECALSFAHVGAFPTGHIDIVRSNGALVCSSLPTRTRVGYRQVSWARSATTKPEELAPERDPRSGQPVAVFTAPFPGGFAAALVNLRDVGPDLAAQFAGSGGVEYIVTAADGQTVLAESGAPARWSGVRLPGAATFAASDHSERRGLDGRIRMFAESTVGGLGWHVYAGLDRSVAMASAMQLFHRELLVILVALLIMLAASIVVHRRITRPVTRLAATVRSGRTPTAAELETFSGTAEVADLTGSFQSLVGRLEAELAERRRAENAAREAEHAARESAETYRLLFESNPMPMWIFDAETLAIVTVNEAAVERYGYTRAEFASMTIKDLRPAEDVPAMMDNLAKASGPLERSGPWRHLRRDGSVLEVEVTSHQVEFLGRPGRLVMATDVTERQRLAGQLGQAQRLESLGQLAGGVAHDFNNLLSVIINYAIFVKDELAPPAGDEVDRLADARADMEEIERAARRAADLTHQLLAFARREVVHPEVVSLNDVVTETEQLLRRTLGEHIDLTRVLSVEPWPIVADPGQMEQVLVNLAVNARDAMPTGGSLVIETANVEVDESYAATRPGLRPGRYVRLRVSDTGGGMDQLTLEHAFEPFFTTKPKGQGTGLGLATVYGIVTQSGGHAQLYSESGVGTTCSIMLPATKQEAELSAPAETHEDGNGELVLLVEDEDGIREVARRILERHGYRVITAGDGYEAIELARDHEGPIELLITDVIMPHMLGKEVAERVLELRPGTRIMYMSGYAEPILGAGEAIPAGMVLLEKPFTEHLLLTKAREALDAVQPRA
jgi:PAS domain S-box-containing protein